jgi:hypothetical protein
MIRNMDVHWSTLAQTTFTGQVWGLSLQGQSSQPEIGVPTFGNVCPCPCLAIWRGQKTLTWPWWIVASITLFVRRTHVRQRLKQSHSVQVIYDFDDLLSEMPVQMSDWQTFQNQLYRRVPSQTNSSQCFARIPHFLSKSGDLLQSPRARN